MDKEEGEDGDEGADNEQEGGGRRFRNKKGRHLKVGLRVCFG